MFTPPTDSQQTAYNETITTTTNRKQIKTKKPGEGEKFDFQSNYIIKLKYSIFNNNKNNKAYKETRKYSPFKGKNITT